MSYTPAQIEAAARALYEEIFGGPLKRAGAPMPVLLDSTTELDFVKAAQEAKPAELFLIDRIRELEAERDSERSRHSKFAEEMAVNTAKLTLRLAEISAERDAIDAATIERCAQEAERLLKGRFSEIPDLPERIRALKPAVPAPSTSE